MSSQLNHRGGPYLIYLNMRERNSSIHLFTPHPDLPPECQGLKSLSHHLLPVGQCVIRMLRREQSQDVNPGTQVGAMWPSRAVSSMWQLTEALLPGLFKPIHLHVMSESSLSLPSWSHRACSMGSP